MVCSKDGSTLVEDATPLDQLTLWTAKQVSASTVGTEPLSWWTLQRMADSGIPILWHVILDKSIWHLNRQTELCAL